ncbi:hypothetical protein AGRA3207_007309 [Actinomadura graeca]|uniref:Uncharacterized protein n=1 Tax=Actinomadura graeca TaxID=2750812 RepID=A0ABX8R689_9ACTN|nr:hypothetical protein AGRA3207_007309 [Actinomadura graeca]
MGTRTISLTRSPNPTYLNNRARQTGATSSCPCSGGKLRWEPGNDKVQTDDWGCDIDGPPAVFVYDKQQHAFATSKNCLQHFWWEPSSEVEHDVWGCGIESTPAGFATGNQQHVFAISQKQPLQHFWYAG